MERVCTLIKIFWKHMEVRSPYEQNFGISARHLIMLLILACGILWDILHESNVIWSIFTCNEYVKSSMFVDRPHYEKSKIMWKLKNGLLRTGSCFERKIPDLKINSDSETFNILGISLDLYRNIYKNFRNEFSKIVYFMRRLKIILAYTYIKVTYFPFFRCILECGAIVNLVVTFSKYKVNLL